MKYLVLFCMDAISVRHLKNAFCALKMTYLVLFCTYRIPRLRLNEKKWAVDFFFPVYPCIGLKQIINSSHLGLTIDSGFTMYICQGRQISDLHDLDHAAGWEP